MAVIEGECVGAAHNLQHPAQDSDSSSLVHCLQLAESLALSGAWNVLACDS